MAFDVEPEYIFVNELEISSSIVSITVSGTRIAVFFNDATIAIWDFEAGASVGWDSGIDLAEDDSSPIHFYSDNVLVSQPGNLFCWEITKMQYERRVVQVENQRFAIFPDMADSEDGDELDLEESYVLPQFQWSHNSSTEFLGFSKGSEFHLFHLRHLLATDNNELLCISPNLVGSCDDIDLANLEDSSAIQPCDGRLMFTGQDYSDVWVVRLDILADESLEMEHVQLCAATGRLCLIVDDAQIRITDFIRPP
ncbi:hypothetical protein CPB84DRAFT_1852433 [Gymnopilus junonius]|uniref:Uncharacterized protein n=1 Tax=Gymnopilus junonius TaxID=109634 RepID=A0A9P5NCJ0_GYMJU|nr:hypothetical protein CPB84DRAFT_1852433 [Gymnopilus junonius]